MALRPATRAPVSYFWVKRRRIASASGHRLASEKPPER